MENDAGNHRGAAVVCMGRHRGIVGGTITTIFKMGIVHRERMAMIRMGINPDAPHAKPYEPEHSEV